MKKIIIIVVIVVLILVGVYFLKQGKDTEEVDKPVVKSISDDNVTTTANDNSTDTTNEDATLTTHEDMMLDELEKSTFNDKYLTYEGTQRGSMLKSLVYSVEESNSKYNGEREVTINFLGKDYKTSEELIKLSTLMKSTANYEVSCEYGSNDMVNCINIVEK